MITLESSPMIAPSQTIFFPTAISEKYIFLKESNKEYSRINVSKIVVMADNIKNINKYAVVTTTVQLQDSIE